MPHERQGSTGRARPAPSTRTAGPRSATEEHVLDLQRLAGNRVVTQLVAQRKVAAPAKGMAPNAKAKRAAMPAESNAAFVKEQVALGRFADPATARDPGPDGLPAPGGAYWFLNGLGPTDLYATLRACGGAVRTALLEHVEESTGLYNRDRLVSALRSAAWNERAGGVAGLTLLDAIQTAGTGSFAEVFALLSGRARPALAQILRTLSRPVLTALRDKLSEAPDEGHDTLTEVVSDLLGSGTDMTASDVIDLDAAGLKGLDRKMANIYNFRGQLIQEQAAALGIGTSAAAGIMLAESGGKTVDAGTDRTLIRFENHVLWARWGKQPVNRETFNAHFDFDRAGKRWTAHTWRESDEGDFEANHQNQAQEWRVLEFAAGLAGDVAYDCASYGAGQIMGFNHGQVGAASARELADSYNRSERAQVTGIFEFIRANHLAAAVAAGDYLTLATRYNGAGKAADYAAVIASAVAAYERVTAGHLHVLP